ncbi:TPA: hypothetical protein P7P83_005174, partial [Escherichia coli]|nr:hypothetical protein [Escherichia coli]
MKITPEQVCEALDAWVCRPGMTQEQATILITEAFWALKERPNIDVQRVTFNDGEVDQGETGPKGDTGPQGEQGPQGETG